MNIQDYVRIGEVVVIIASVSGVGILWNTIKTYKENNESLKEKIDLIEMRTADCVAKHEENKRLIDTLQGEVNAYKELVLVPQEFINQTQKNQKEIIKLLQEKK